MAKEIVVYGADWCGDTRRTLKHLDDTKVEYKYIDIDADADGEAKVIEWNKGKRRIPTLELGSGASATRLSVPSDSDLDAAIAKLI
ncbi:MAG TPA: glutaredoxin domain-containing protein [Thermoanaerobaculia bacterium]|nr:glutaredoxin domain-containing protein [Thermoanaerobaculia bacterium]